MADENVMSEVAGSVVGGAAGAVLAEYLTRAGLPATAVGAAMAGVGALGALVIPGAAQSVVLGIAASGAAQLAVLMRGAAEAETGQPEQRNVLLHFEPDAAVLAEEDFMAAVFGE